MINSSDERVAACNALGKPAGQKRTATPVLAKSQIDLVQYLAASAAD
jgi:hypothetical protein